MTKQTKNFIPISDEQIAMIEKTEERKNRFTGETGHACDLHFDIATGCLSEIQNRDF